jgi:CheY-like chemotaxis protein
VIAGETKLAQVLINLLTNAAHAISEGEPERNTIRVATETDSLGRVVIEVEDTGSGIPAHIMPHIFEPFFTTKQLGTGAGLGLSICHGIVESLGGEISVRGAAKRGSIFRVVLPAAPVTPLRPLASDPAPQRGRILVVDDEPGFLRAVSALLEDEHEVIAVADAREGLRLIERGERFDLVLCDVIMPGFDGMDLYEQVKRNQPGLAPRFVFITGGAFTTRASDFLAMTPNARIQKPFDPAALRATLQRELRRAGAVKPC